MLSAWILVVVVFATLYAFWRMLEFTFDLIEQAHARMRKEDLRAPAEPRDAGVELIGEKDA